MKDLGTLRQALWETADQAKARDDLDIAAIMKRGRRLRFRRRIAAAGGTLCVAAVVYGVVIGTAHLTRPSPAPVRPAGPARFLPTAPSPASTATHARPGPPSPTPSPAATGGQAISPIASPSPVAGVASNSPHPSAMQPSRASSP
jgi:hypothetical protein